MNYSQLRVAGLVGLLSGIINALIVWNETPLGGLLMLGYAGITFGIVTGIYFTRAIVNTHKYLRFLLWVVVSGISYYAGMRATIGSLNEANELFSISLAIGGSIGALILGISFHFIFKKLGLLQHIMLVAAGAIVALIVGLLFPNSVESQFFVPVLYICWQTVIAGMLGSLFTEVIITSSTKEYSKAVLHDQEITVPTNGLSSR